MVNVDALKSAMQGTRCWCGTMVYAAGDGDVVAVAALQAMERVCGGLIAAIAGTGGAQKEAMRSTRQVVPGQCGYGTQMWVAPLCSTVPLIEQQCAATADGRCGEDGWHRSSCNDKRGSLGAEDVSGSEACANEPCVARTCNTPLKPKDTPAVVAIPSCVSVSVHLVGNDASGSTVDPDLRHVANVTLKNRFEPLTDEAEDAGAAPRCPVGCVAESELAGAEVTRSAERGPRLRRVVLRAEHPGADAVVHAGELDAGGLTAMDDAGRSEDGMQMHAAAPGSSGGIVEKHGAPTAGGSCGNAVQHRRSRNRSGGRPGANDDSGSEVCTCDGRTASIKAAPLKPLGIPTCGSDRSSRGMPANGEGKLHGCSTVSPESLEDACGDLMKWPEAPLLVKGGGGAAGAGPRLRRVAPRVAKLGDVVEPLTGPPSTGGHTAADIAGCSEDGKRMQGSDEDRADGTKRTEAPLSETGAGVAAATGGNGKPAPAELAQVCEQRPGPFGGGGNMAEVEKLLDQFLDSGVLAGHSEPDARARTSVQWPGPFGRGGTSRPRS